ncbi:MAG: TldD protein, partial [Myxococcota bacterium]
MRPENLTQAFETFGITEAQTRQVISKAMSRGGEFCDLFFQRSRTTHLALEDGAVNRASTSSDLGVGIRVVNGVETGYAYSESLDNVSLLDAAAVAASVASGASQAAPTAFKVGKQHDYYPISVPYDDVPTLSKVALLKNLQERVAEIDPRVIKISVSYRDETVDVLVVDSHGRVAFDHQPMTICYVSAVAEQNGKRESNYVGMGGREGFDFYTDARMEKAAQEVVERTTILFDAVDGPVGEFPVVLGPGSSGILLHEAIGHGMEADA